MIKAIAVIMKKSMPEDIFVKIALNVTVEKTGETFKATIDVS